MGTKPKGMPPYDDLDPLPGQRLPWEGLSDETPEEDEDEEDDNWLPKEPVGDPAPG